MSMRDRLSAILSRVPFGLGTPGVMDHPTGGGFARNREQDESDTANPEDDASER